MTRWEYCVLTGISAGDANCCLNTYYPRLFRLTSKGFELISNFRARTGTNDTEPLAVARTIFQLGEDGWELVVGQTYEGLPSTNSHNSLWFKREKSV